MAIKTWTLTDTDRDVYVETLSLGPDDVPGTPAGWSASKRTLRGGKQDGVDVVEVDNGEFRFAVLPTRGMGVWRGWRGDTTLGWNSPVRGPVHPRFVPLSEPSGLGWLDGFDELLVRCGLESNGAPDFDEHHTLTHPVHGRIANLPAHKVEVAIDDATGEIRIAGVVDECRFHFQKLRLTSTISTRPGERGFRVRDEITNFGGAAAEMQLLYHVNFGPPLLDAGAKVVAPVKTLVPRNDHAASGVGSWDTYAAEQPGGVEQVYFFDLAANDNGDSQVLLKNASATAGVSLAFNKKQLPCFTQWKNQVAAADGYVTGLEPATNFPNPRSYEAEQGRVVRIEPGARQAFDLQLEWHIAAEDVAAAEQAVGELQSGVEPKIHDRPQSGWCAD